MVYLKRLIVYYFCHKLRKEFRLIHFLHLACALLLTTNAGFALSAEQKSSKQEESDQSQHAQNFALPTEQLTPGGVAILNLGENFDGAPKATFNDIPVAVVNTTAGFRALVGIPLTTAPGKHTVKIIKSDGSAELHEIDVHSKDYPEQHITIKNKRQVNPNETDLVRIRKDRTSIANAKRYRHDDLLGLRFDVPVEGIRSGSFGSRRFFNKQPRRPHGGMDIAAPEGTPIFAPADGYVIEAADYFFSGNCIFLGHGQGLQTFYAHMSKIDVKPGELVKRGQKIGEVGATGRVTGAHLHWSVGLNRTWVDPELFLIK